LSLLIFALESVASFGDGEIVPGAFGEVETLMFVIGLTPTVIDGVFFVAFKLIIELILFKQK
jgi:hypothetical protein